MINHIGYPDLVKNDTALDEYYKGVRSLMVTLNELLTALLPYAGVR